MARVTRSAERGLGPLEEIPEALLSCINILEVLIMEIDNLFYAKTTINGRDIDLVLTEQQILDGVKTALNNSEFVCQMNPGNCWPVEKPEGCSFWQKLFKVCDCKF
jgi:hypothetical protein